MHILAQNTYGMDSAPSSPPLLRPLPRRPFQLTSDSSNESSNVATPHHGEAAQEEQGLDVKESEMEKTKSILNLTSSTLFGIYAPTAFDSASEPQTPWGTGAETPMHRGSLDGYPSARGGFREQDIQERLLRESLRTSGLDARRGSVESPVSPSGISTRHVPRSTSGDAVRLGLRIIVLFGCGLAYGSLVAHLHDNRRVSPVQLEGLNREGWRYLAFWGTASVILGLMMPWVDSFGTVEEAKSPLKSKATATSLPPITAVEWNDVVRSIGAFIGVAYAIRKTPWASQLQLSATLAMVNPFLWYLLDRTSAGFLLSTASGFLGIIGVLILNPAWIPAPSHSLLKHTNSSMLHADVQQNGVPKVLEHFLTHERVSSAIWIGSVFFCSCICFGNIGRLIATAQQSRRRV